MDLTKTWISRMYYFAFAIILGTEVSRFFHRQNLLKLIEKDSYLIETVDKNVGMFDFYHIITNYLPLLVFCLAIFTFSNSSRLRNFRNLYVISGFALFSSIVLLFFSEKYLDFCKGYYFTNQLGILISYYFAAAFVLKTTRINFRIVYFILALFFNSLFAQFLQPVVFKIKYGSTYFPIGRIEIAVMVIYACFICFFLILNRNKKME